MKRYLLIFGEIASQTLVDVGTAQDQETTVLTPDPWEKLGKHIANNHSQSCLCLDINLVLWSKENLIYLNVLERQIFGIGATVHLELRILAGDQGEDTLDGTHSGVHVQIDVVSVAIS